MFRSIKIACIVWANSKQNFAKNMVERNPRFVYIDIDNRQYRQSIQLSIISSHISAITRHYKIILFKMKIWLIGEAKTLPTNGLPSIADVLRGYHYNHLVLDNVKQTSIILLTKELIKIWKTAEKTTSEERNVARKIGNLVRKFELFKKGKTRRSKDRIIKEKNWKKYSKKCFDIASIVKQGGQRQEKKQLSNKNINETDFDNLSISDTCSILDEVNNDDCDDIDYCNDLSKYHKKQLNKQAVASNSGVLQKIINSSDVSSALDRTNIESGKFAIVAAAIGRACGDDVSKEVFSLSTLKRRREKHRSDLDTSIKKEFDQQEKKSLVVHWDGKRLKDLTNPDSACIDNKIERIGIVVNGINVNKIINVSRAESGTGLVTSDIVYEKLRQSGVLDNVIGMCTDTTPANTGHTNGACALFEKKMEKPLLYFACQHHVHEVVLGGVYEELMGETNGPEHALFKALKTEWPKLKNRNAYEVRNRSEESFNFFAAKCFIFNLPFAHSQAIDEKVFKENKQRNKLRKEVKDCILPILSTSKKDGYFPQDNYREILELSLLLMGHQIPNYVLKKPGACHKARWMAPAIYSMKRYLLRKILKLPPEEEDNLKEFCLFVSLIYVKSWIQCQITTNAPKNTLEFYKKIYNYSTLNEKVSIKALSKFESHLWYIGPEMIFLSLFSSDVKPSDKQKIFNQMVSKDKGWTERSWQLKNCQNLHKKQLHQLVGSASLSALKSLRVDIQFMFDFNAAEWNNLQEYKDAKKVVDSLKVVNDIAERSLKLMTDINGKHTKNENGTQQLIQVIQDNRNRVSSTHKTVLSSYERR